MSKQFADKIYNMYHKDYMSLNEIAEAFGCSKQHIHKVASDAGYSFPALPRHGFKNPNCREKELFLKAVRSFSTQLRVAEFLGIPNKTLPIWFKYHNISKKEMIPYRGTETIGKWKGGRYQDSKTGYIWVDCYEEDYYSINPKWKAKKVHEHKLQVERYILGGRALPRPYCIHHRDEDRANNDLENLCILTINQHRRFHGILNHAKAKIEEGMDDFDIQVLANRLDNLLDIWNAANLSAIRVESYLKTNDILEVGLIFDTNDREAFLLDCPRVTTKKQSLPLWTGPGYEIEKV